MPDDAHYSPRFRRLLGLVALLFGLLGAALFAAPDWAAAAFPWKVSPFVAMTMGGWYLGSAFVAALCYARPRWPETYGSLAYLGAFAVLELGLLALFRQVFRPDAPLAWPYVGTLGVATLAALVGLAEVRRARGAGPRLGPVAGWVRLELLALVGLTWVLAFLGPGSFGADASVFPEPLTPLTVRGFAAFYFSLGLGALVLLWARDLAPVATFVTGGYSLIFAITAAAIVYLEAFDFGARPGGLLYLGAYVGAAIGAAFIVVEVRRRRRAAA